MGLKTPRQHRPSESHLAGDARESTVKRRRYNFIWVDCPHCHSAGSLKVRRDRDVRHPDTNRPLALDGQCEVCSVEENYAPPPHTDPTINGTGHTYSTLRGLTDEELEEVSKSVNLKELPMAPLPEALRPTGDNHDKYPVDRGLGWWLFSDNKARRVGSEEKAIDLEASLRDPTRNTTTDG